MSRKVSEAYDNIRSNWRETTLEMQKLEEENYQDTINIDLDDGVKVNYARFGKILRKI